MRQDQQKNPGEGQGDEWPHEERRTHDALEGPMEDPDEIVTEAAQVAQLHDSIQDFPQGWRTFLGERGINLSGGQKQRVAIARTLLLDPSILIFDDSTASVDTQTEFLIQQALATLMEGRTTFVIAQRLRTVMRADEILVLEDGAVVQRGRHEELLLEEGLYRNIYDLELRDQEEALGDPSSTATTDNRAPAPTGSGGGN